MGAVSPAPQASGVATVGVVPAGAPERTNAAAPRLQINAEALGTILDCCQDPSVLASGCVNIIALDAIRARLGSRWELRREFVHEHAQRAIEKQLGSGSVFQRVGETYYAVVQPDTPRLIAQAVCLRCAREILHYFLGEAVLTDIKLHEVTRIDPDGVYGHHVDVVALAAAEAKLPLDISAACGVPQPPPHRTVDQWTPFVASDGRRVRVSCVLEPVLHLTSSTRIGYRLARRVIELPSERQLTPAELQNLSRSDIARIDYATISRGLDRLHAEIGGDKLPTLIVPVSLITLSNQRTREVFVGLLKEVQSEVRHGLVCEIWDIEGAPAGTLLTAISLIKPFCLRVIGCVLPVKTGGLQRLKGVGLQGVAVECPPNLGDAEFIGWLKDVRSSSRPVADMLFVFRLENMRRAAMASLAGISHMSLSSAARTVFVN